MYYRRMNMGSMRLRGLQFVTLMFIVLFACLSCSKANQAKINLNLGSKSALDGDYEKAISYYNKAIELDPSLAEAYGFRGNLYAVMDNFEKAIEDCTEAIKLNPNLAMAYSLRGISYFKLGNDKNAIEDLEKALKIDPNDESAKQALEAARFLYSW